MEKHKESLNSIITSRKIAEGLKTIIMKFIGTIAIIMFGITLSALITDYAKNHEHTLEEIYRKVSNMINKLQSPITSRRI